MSKSDITIPNTSGASEEAAMLVVESCPVRAAYDAAAQALHEALARKKALIERAATMTRAREAAQAEADAARQQWSGLLREADGTLTRDIQKLRVAETSALTLVEEYTAMRQEIGMQITVMEVTVAELAEVAIGKRSKVIELASREAFANMVEDIGDAIASAFALYERAARASSNYSLANDREVRTAFFEQLGGQLDKRMKAMADGVTWPEGPCELKLKGVDMALVASPLRRAQLLQSSSLTRSA